MSPSRRKAKTRRGMTWVGDLTVVMETILARAGMAPLAPLKCPDGVAVGADQFALLGLGEQARPVPAIDQECDIALLDCSRQVVPLHCGRVKGGATLGTGPPLLQTDVP